MKCSVCGKSKKDGRYVFFIMSNHKPICDECKKDKEKKEGRRCKKEVYWEELPLK